MKLLTAACFSICLFATSIFAQENYAAWSYYKTLTVNTTATGANLAGNVTGYPLLVRLSVADTLIGALPTGADLRFTKSDGVTRLKHQLERWDTAAKVAEVWVLMDTVYGNDSTHSFRLYWGKSNATDSSIGASVFAPARNFVAVWHMAEATGNVADASGGGNTGLNVGTTTAAGSVGNGRAFSGTGQWITVANSANNAALDANIANSYSVSAWFNATNWNGNPRIFQRGGTAPKYGLFDTVSSLFWYTNPTGNVAGLRVTRPTTGAWHLAQCVYNGAAASLYVDGALAASASAAGAITNSTLAMILGGKTTSADGSGSINLFTGTLDEIRLHSIARDSNWARLDFETQKTGAAFLKRGASVSQAAVAPSVAKQPANQTALVGGTVKFSVVADGTPPLTYKWVKNNTDTVGTNSDTLTLTNVQMTDSNSNYKVVIRNSLNQAVSNAAILTVTAPIAASITSQPAASQTVIVGAAVKIGVKAAGTAPLTYKWVKNNTDTVGTNSDTLTFSTVARADTGSYKCVVRNVVNTAISNAATLVVNPVSIFPVKPGETFSMRSQGSDILFVLPEGVFGARISVMDFRGRSLWSGVAGAGKREVLWAKGSSGKMASGLYVVRVNLLNGEGRPGSAFESRLLIVP